MTLRPSFSLVLKMTFLFCFFNSVNALKASIENTGGIDTTVSPSLFDLVDSKSKVTFHLSEKIKTINKNFKKDEAETAGTINIKTEDGDYSFSVDFSPGGKSRRKICSFPPIKMDLKKKELETNSLNKKCDKIKLVFQCSSSGSMAESIKKEKFVYDLYALVTPYGRRAKLVKVVIADKDKEYDAMLLEDDKDMDARLNLNRLKVGSIAPEAVNRKEYVKMCLFQYMISNADWSARRGHNTEVYKRNSDNSLIIVPYDFDYSGLINNSYAIAPENLPINKVTDRYFMDKTVGLDELKEGVEFFKSIEDEVHELCMNSTYLSEGSRKRLSKFLGEFYKTIHNEKKVERMLKK